MEFSDHALFCPPRQIFSDNESEFNNELMKELGNSFGIRVS